MKNRFVIQSKHANSEYNGIKGEKPTFSRIEAEKDTYGLDWVEFDMCWRILELNDNDEIVSVGRMSYKETPSKVVWHPTEEESRNFQKSK